jgi:rhodanese-related sulfurtransferase
MNRTIIMAALAAALAFLPGNSPAADYESVDARTLRAWMGREELTLVNVMSRIECLDHRIPGSLCIACEEFREKATALPKDRKIVFTCETDVCTRSCQAAREARTMGFSKIFVLAGGMPAWKRAGYALESVQRIPRVPVRAIKAAELGRWQKDNPDHLVLDIRSEEKFVKGHIQGAVNIPVYRLHQRYQELPMDRLILVVDDRGFRSFLISSYLARKGLRAVRLFGGMEKWQEFKKLRGQAR